MNRRKFIKLATATGSAGMVGNANNAFASNPSRITPIINYLLTDTPAPAATITFDRSIHQVAPEGFNFQIELENFDTPGPSPETGDYDPQYHDIYFVWSFGEPGRTYDKPERLLPIHRLANIGYGPIATHTYDTPGTYAITCDIIEPASGKTAQASVTITVGDASSISAGNQTLYVDPDGDFSEAPAGAETFTDIQTAFVVSQGRSQTGFCRMMLNNGKTFPGLTGDQMRAGWRNLFIVSRDKDGPKPIVLCERLSPGSNRSSVFEDQTSNTGSFPLTKQTQLTFAHIDWRGVWDTKTETPDDNTNVNFLIHRTNRCTYLNIHDCTASGFSTFIADQSAEGTQPEGNFVRDHTNVFTDIMCTNWQNFAIYMDRWSSCGIVGCSFVQDVEAMSGGGKGLLHNEHGPIRILSLIHI